MKRSKTVVTARSPLWAVFACTVLLSACGDGDKPPAATQVVAKVNGSELTVHQVNHVLEQSPELASQGDAGSRQVLERLIDQQLAVDQATNEKLDRDPAVMSDLEAARRDVLARDYLQRVTAKITPPTEEDARAYYEAKPALFAQRQIFNLDELQFTLSSDQETALHNLLKSAHGPDSIVHWANEQKIRLAASQSIRPAESLPMNLLDAVAAAQDGQGVVSADGKNVRVVFVMGRNTSPVTFDVAKPAILQALANQRRRDMVQAEIQRLRSQAKIEYVGAFAPRVAAALSTANVPSAPASAETQAGRSTLDQESVKRGLGIR
jgi:EpsD family peptidyl-prolyl cis-trans isomerase